MNGILIELTLISCQTQSFSRCSSNRFKKFKLYFLQTVKINHWIYLIGILTELTSISCQT